MRRPCERAWRQYLQRFSYGNATWPDLISILDTHTDIDLAGLE